MPVRFLLNGKICTESSVSPSTTVLDYLRETRGLKGTKEGCAEGDCGACTIVTADCREGRTKFGAANACLMLVPQLGGKAVWTVEGVSDGAGRPHPVQSALLESHGTQCGFCTPGFVMALFAFYRSSEPKNLANVHDVLAGNLCRCTGYRPIVDAAMTLAPPTDADASEIAQALAGTAIDEIYEHGGERFYAPASLNRLLALRAEHRRAVLLGGGTDLGVLASRDRARFDQVIWTGRVPELNRIERNGSDLTIGAAVTYTQALPVIDADYPSFGGLIRRIGSRQIRNLGTFGGNACTASPIGDTLPCLLALGATFVARSRSGVRHIPAVEFFLGYRRTALAGDEVLEAVTLPRLQPDAVFRTYKISKRFDQDIAAVIGAFALTVRAGRVESARVAFGGMAATPARARACETALQGAPWSPATVAAAAAELEREFSPINDLRASAGYRRRVAGNLLWRLHAETTNYGQPTEIMAL